MENPHFERSEDFFSEIRNQITNRYFLLTRNPVPCWAAMITTSLI